MIHCAEALGWLRALPGPLANSSFITSLPDVSEFPGLSLTAWKAWFVDAARAVLAHCPEEGVTLFFQTDVKKSGEWVDKGFLCQRAAELEGAPLRSHKIVCRTPPGSTTFGKPAYSHLLCFSRGIELDLRLATADVLPGAGATSWTRGMGVDACRAACKLVLDHTATRTVVDPFCGHGTVLAVANALGLDAVGVELSAKRARRARTMTLEGLERFRRKGSEG